MAQRSSSSLTATFIATAAALMIASCGIEAAEQPQSTSSAEKLAERFAGRTEQTPAPTDEQKALSAAKSAEAKRIAAAKREEKARKAAAEAAAAKAEAEKTAAQIKADEEEMLAQAKAEADQRRADIETERREREKADAIRIAAEAEAKKRAEDARLAEERSAAEAKAKVLAEAEAKKRADEARVAEEKAVAESKAKMLTDAEAQEKLRAAELQRVAERERAEQESRAAELKILQARREEESRQLAERLAAVEAARQAKTAAAEVEIARSQLPSSASMPLPAVPGTAAGRMTRATILIIMEPGSTGIRRLEKTADPVLCTRTGCYISAGAGAPAKFVAMAKALGPGGTLGERAGACKHSLSCVFRDVDLTASTGYLQPVDMKIMRHDRRESHIVTTDSECRLAADRLACRRPIVTTGYRMWVLNEGLAALAGPDALDAALRDGLPPPKGQSAGLDQ